MQTTQTGQLWDRQTHRIDYDGAVRVLSPGRGDTIYARATNLSERGVFVASDVLCDIGCEVVCDLPLADERLTVRGRVAWLRPERAERGMGIEFVDLADDVAATLKQLVGPSSSLSERVKVRFEGMPEAVRAEALRTGSGICLRTALPFLRLNSPVEFVFAADGDAAPQTGWLEDVSLRADPESPVPRLQVRVATPEDVLAAVTDDDFEAELEADLEHDFEILTAAPVAAAPQGDAMALSAEPDFEPPPLPDDLDEIVGQIEAIPEQKAGVSSTSEVYVESCLPSVVIEQTLIEEHAEEQLEQAPPLPLLRVKSRPTVRRPELTDQLLPKLREANYELPSDPLERSHWEFSSEAAALRDDAQLPGMDPLAEDEDFWQRSSPPRRRFWLWTAALSMAALAIGSASYTGFFARVGDETTRWVQAVKGVLGGSGAERPMPAASPAQPTTVAADSSEPATTREPAKTEPTAGEPTAKTEPAKAEPAKSEVATKNEAATKSEAAAKSTAGPSASVSDRWIVSRHPRLRSVGKSIVLSVPLRGSLRGKRSYRLSKPDGIVVRLPHARAGLRQGIHRLKRSGFRVLWVRPDGDGVRLRVLFQRPTPRCSVEIERREVSVRCQQAASVAAL